MDLNLPDVLNFCARRRINFPSNPRAPDSKGVSDALRRRYLKKLTFFISECEDSDSCIELYTFSFEVRASLSEADLSAPRSIVRPLSSLTLLPLSSRPLLPSCHA